jgi:hypothetical protein
MSRNQASLAVLFVFTFLFLFLAPLALPGTASDVATGSTPSPTMTLTPQAEATLQRAIWRVTPAPTPRDVLEAATRLVALQGELTRRALEEGVSYRMVTMTFTPRPFVVTSTPTPGNQLTATVVQLMAEARAFTTGTPTPLPEGWVTATPRHTATPRPSPTPRPLYVLLTDLETLHSVLRPTNTPSPTPARMPSSLIGKIAFRSYLLGGSIGQGRILLVDPDGSNLSYMPDLWAYRLTLERERTSPNGRYIVYQEKTSRGLNLFLAPTDGGEHQQVTFVGKGKAFDMAWSPDSRFIAYSSNQEGDDDIFVVEIPGWSRSTPHTVKLTHDDGWQSDKHPSFSPDGSRIVFHSNRTGRNQIWVMNADGSDLRQLIELDSDCWNPVWIKDDPIARIAAP